MALADLADVNTHLPADKAQAQTADVVDLLIDAQRLIRGRLAQVLEIEVLNLWTDPDETPEIIRHIAGKLAAAKFYANLVAEDEADGSQFAKDLYDQAIAELNAIITGATDVIDPDGVVIDVDTSSDLSFSPNGQSSDPFFAVADQWS